MAKPVTTPKVTSKLIPVVRFRACDQCGYAHDGSPIARASHQVEVLGMSLYFCDHHFSSHGLSFLENGYRCTPA